MPRRALPFHQRSPEYVTLTGLATILVAIALGVVLGLILGGFSVTFR